MVKKTWKRARRVALRAYSKVLRAAERGDWEEAGALLDMSACAFCVVQRADDPDWRLDELPATRKQCPTCPALRICRRAPFMITGRVEEGRITRREGIRRLALTVAQLEALDV